MNVEDILTLSYHDSNVNDGKEKDNGSFDNGWWIVVGRPPVA